MRKSKKTTHSLCANCRKTEKPVIEVVKMVRGISKVTDLTYHKIIFIIEGKVRLFSKENPEHQVAKGKMLFLLAGNRYSYSALEGSTVILFRVQAPINLCNNFSLEDLYMHVNKKLEKEYKPENSNFGELEIAPQIWQLLNTISESIKDGVTCHYWLEIKVKEFFLLLKSYYTKEKIYKFLYLILSNDIVFSEQVRQHWNKFQTARELAVFLNLTTKKFTARFTAVFGQTPYQWMLQERARIVHVEIISTEKQFKQIAMENGFVSESSFTRFCRKEFNKTPTQVRLDKYENIRIL